MVAWRTLASLAVALAVTGSVQAQTYEVAEAPQAGCFFDVQLTMDLAAELRVHKDDKVVRINERAKFGLQAKFYNALNQVTFAGPSVITVGNANFGSAGGVNSSPRTVEIGGKLSF